MTALAACGGSNPPATAPAQATSTQSGRGAALDDCVASNANARSVTLTVDGEQVGGAEFGTSGDVGVVLAHEYMANLCGWVPYAEHLRSNGHRALAFDFRSHLVDEVSAAANQLRHDGATKIVLMGASMGGTASLVAAASASSPVAAVAALSAPSEFMGLDGTAASRQLTIPVLYLAAQDNGEFPADARAMYAVCPSPHKQLQVLAGSDHGTALLRGSDAAQSQSLLDALVGSIS